MYLPESDDDVEEEEICISETFGALVPNESEIDPGMILYESTSPDIDLTQSPQQSDLTAFTKMHRLYRDDYYNEDSVEFFVNSQLDNALEVLGTDAASLKQYASGGIFDLDVLRKKISLHYSRKKRLTNVHIPKFAVKVADEVTDHMVSHFKCC